MRATVGRGVVPPVRVLVDVGCDIVGVVVVRADTFFADVLRVRVVAVRERAAVPRCSVVAGRVVVVLRREFVVVTAVVRRLAVRVVFGVTSAVAV